MSTGFLLEGWLEFYSTESKEWTYCAKHNLLEGELPDLHIFFFLISLIANEN